MLIAYQLRCGSTVDRDVNPGLIDGIDRYSSADVFSTHDLNWFGFPVKYFSICSLNQSFDIIDSVT